MKTGTRWAVLGLVVVVAVVGFVIAQSGGGSSGSSTRTASGTTATGTAATAAKPQLVVVKNGKPVGGVQDINVKKGGRVRFAVQSDVADEVHIHGYNFHKNVPENGSVTFDFPATIDGGFVVELETRGEQIAALKVQP